MPSLQELHTAAGVNKLPIEEFEDMSLVYPPRRSVRNRFRNAGAQSSPKAHVHDAEIEIGEGPDPSCKDHHWGRRKLARDR